jgi:hypothetical protein
VPELPRTPPVDRARHPGLEKEEAMIADKPIDAAEYFTNVAERVQAFILSARRASETGISWSEFGELLVALLRMTITTLDGLKELTGPEKKEIVVYAAGILFDNVAGYAVPVWLFPVWFLARPAVRSLVVALAGGAVEILLPMVRAT